MLERLPFPATYFLEAVLFLAVVFGFLGAVSFFAAVPVAELDLQGKALPAHWDAAVMNHGRYLQGHLISSQPAIFGLVMALLLGSGCLLILVQRATAAQRINAGASGRAAHYIAQGGVFAVVGAVIHLLVMHVLVGVHPA